MYNVVTCSQPTFFQHEINYIFYGFNPLYSNHRLSVSQICGFMDLINYEIWIAYQKVNLKVKAEMLSSFPQKGLYLYFLLYFIVEVKYSAKTYLLMDFFTERERGFFNKLVFFTEQEINICSTFKQYYNVKSKLAKEKISS